METTELRAVADGVQLCAVQTERFKTCQVLISMALPMSGDIAARAIVPYILRSSCRKYPDFSALNGRLDTLYGAVLGASVSKKGEAQLLQMVISSIDDRFALDGESVAEDATALLMDLLFDPKLQDGTFPTQTVEAEKRLLLERMLSEDDDKRVYARRRCQEIMCDKEPFGRNRYGTVEEIESLTPERVYAAWQEILKTAVIRVVVVSSGTGEQVETLLKKQFSAMERTPVDIQTQFIRSAEKEKYVRETQPLMQGTLVMGFRCGMENAGTMDPAMSVMNDLFGGGTYSKLFTVVREQMSLCYYCASRLNRDKGILLVSAGIETENEEKAREAILDQLRAMQNGDFTKEMFDTSIRSLCDTIRGYTDSPDVLCAWYAAQIFRNTVKTTAQRIEEFQNVQFEDIQKAAGCITPDTVFMLAGTGENADA